MDDLMLNQFLLLAAILFSIGVYGVIARKNTVMVLMSIELILNAVNINLLTFGALQGNITGAVFALFIIAVAAAEVGVGLAMVLIIAATLAVAFVLILFFGKRMPRKGSEIGIAAVGIAFVLAIATNVQWFDHVNNPPEHGTGTEEEGPAEGGEEHGLGAVTVEGESAAPTPAPSQEAAP